MGQKIPVFRPWGSNGSTQYVYVGDETPPTIIIDNKVINQDSKRKSEEEGLPFNKD